MYNDIRRLYSRCNECGSPIEIVYSIEPNRTWECVRVKTQYRCRKCNVCFRIKLIQISDDVYLNK